MLKRKYSVEPRTNIVTASVHLVPVVIASNQKQMAYDADSEDSDGKGTIESLWHLKNGPNNWHNLIDSCKHEL